MAFKKIIFAQNFFLFCSQPRYGLVRDAHNSAKGVLFPAEQKPLQVYSAEQNFDNNGTSIPSSVLKGGGAKSGNPGVMSPTMVQMQLAFVVILF
jgi:hypothetical protein